MATFVTTSTDHNHIIQQWLSKEGTEGQAGRESRLIAMCGHTIERTLYRTYIHSVTWLIIRIDFIF